MRRFNGALRAIGAMVAIAGMETRSADYFRRAQELSNQITRIPHDTQPAADVEMQAEGQRFECFRDPANKWVIWDKVTGQPAHFSQITLVGLSEWEAVSMCRLLNNLDRDQKPAKSSG